MKMETRMLRICGYLILCGIICANGEGLQYSIKENVRIGFLVGNVRTDAKLDNITASNKLHFRILTKGNPHSELFQIRNSGELTVNASIDREALCAFITTCELQIEIIASTGATFFQNLKLKITVEDVNDNPPKFPTEYLNLSFLESEPLNAFVTFIGATDSDSDSRNTLQSVTIVPSDVPFRVEFKKNLDRTSQILLYVKDKLDREHQALYNLKLIAKDGGSPPLSSAMDVQITILDVNDNSPEFSRPEYNVTINENTTLGVVIAQVTAADADEGSNGDILYRISTHQNIELRRYFSMDGDSGEMRLQKRLSSGHIQVIVEASDKGSPPKISQAFMEIDILDTINNPPAITLNILNGGNTAKVLESVNIDFPIAHIKISDPDTGANNIVTCFSQVAGFRLKPLDDKEYKVVIAKPLDYETTKSYVVTIFCRDGGFPVLNTTKEFTVDVLDVNDNEPEFLVSEVFMNIAENNAIGDTMTQLAATDRDSGVNKKLTYSVAKEASVNFTIQSDVPIIRAKIRFDREDTAQYVFKVFAVDGGKPAKTATATVTINILDINDERPAFWQQAYYFKVSENLPIGANVGNVSAFDLDTGDGGKFTLKVDPFPPAPRPPFTILQNGTLITTGVLDREVVSEYMFKAVATDHGTNSLSGMAQITVVIIDKNDNDPYFIYPNDVNFSASVYVSSKAGSIQAQVQASDLDSDSNSVIYYDAKDLNTSGLFEINKKTGEIYITKDITPKMVGTYHLLLRISNTEPNSKSITHRFKIVIAPQPMSGAILESKDQYIVIVIVLVCATLLIAAAILVALCYLRKRDKDRQLKQVYEQDTASGSTYGLQNPATETDTVLSNEKSNMQRGKYVKEKKADLDTSSSTMNGHIITTGKTISPAARTTYHTSPEPVVHDREHQRQNQLMSFRLHQALQRLNSETSSQDHSKIIAANAKVMEWRDGQRRSDDFNSTSSGEITTGDSGHGSDEDSHIISSDRSSSPQKIRLGIGAIKPMTHPPASSNVPPRSQVSPIKGTKMPAKGRNVPVLYTSGFNFPSKKDSGYPGYEVQHSPRSDSVDDVDDTTTSGSYSITVEDIKSDLGDFDYHPVQDVYV